MVPNKFEEIMFSGVRSRVSKGKTRGSNLLFKTLNVLNILFEKIPPSNPILIFLFFNVCDFPYLRMRTMLIVATIAYILVS